MRKTILLLGIILGIILIAWYQEDHIMSTKSSTLPTIVYTEQASIQEILAAKEVRRYLYLRTGKLVNLMSVDKIPPSGQIIVVANADSPFFQGTSWSSLSLKEQEYVIRTVSQNGRKLLLIVGGDSTGTLYGAYRFAEHMGVRFYLHGDVIPDECVSYELPALDDTGKPLFNIRGILPFHDFPEGPDWWTLDDYKTYLAQLPKLRMNFIGLHTYPQGAGPEPTTWHGLAEDIGKGSEVKFAYTTSYQNNLRNSWGYAPAKTSEFHFGASELFESENHTAEVQDGMDPRTNGQDQHRLVYQRAGKFFNNAFTFARRLGIKVCIGTETPLIPPDELKTHLLEKGKDPTDPKVIQEIYEGTFKRIMQSHPLDYYWLWTPEVWTWSDSSDQEVTTTENDIFIAYKAAKKVNAPFTLATSGWVLGPPKDRAQFDKSLPKEMPFSCINRQVGKEPVEPGFAKVIGRSKWAIPWLEDDPGIISPQFWVGRMRKDAVDALKYGCTGLIGIHWRTKVFGPNISALANAAWDQPWASVTDKPNPDDETTLIGAIGGELHDHIQPIGGTERYLFHSLEERLYQQSRCKIKAYNLNTTTPF